LACHSHTQATSQIAIILGYSADFKNKWPHQLAAKKRR
jgi:hypothetical protein